MILGKANQPTEAKMHMALGFNSSPQVGMSDTECITVLLVIIQLDSLAPNQEKVRSILFQSYEKKCPFVRD